MGKAYDIPTLGANVTPELLADELALWRGRKKEADFYEGFYKEAIKARWPTEERATEDGGTQSFYVPEIRGQKYVAKISQGSQTRFDIDACRADAEAGDPIAKAALEKYLKTGTPFLTIKTVERAAETLQKADTA